MYYMQCIPDTFILNLCLFVIECRVFVLCTSCVRRARVTFNCVCIFVCNWQQQKKNKNTGPGVMLIVLQFYIERNEFKTLLVSMATNGLFLPDACQRHIPVYLFLINCFFFLFFFLSVNFCHKRVMWHLIRTLDFNFFFHNFSHNIFPTQHTYNPFS